MACKANGWRRSFLGVALACGLALTTACPASGPRVRELDPGAGPWGQSVVIRGEGLEDANSVQFTPQVSATIVPTGEGEALTAVVPMGAQDGPVTVVVGSESVSSPYDFVVQNSTYREQEGVSASGNSNDQRNRAETVPTFPGAQDREALGFLVEGTLDPRDPGDWFQTTTGPGNNRLGPWAYTLEVEVENFSSRGLTCQLNVKNDELLQFAVPPQLSTAEPGTAARWVTAIDSKKFFVAVLPGAGTPTVEARDYRIRVARIPVEDPGEPNDTAQEAEPLPAPVQDLNGRYTITADRFLTAAYDPAVDSELGRVDFYRLPAMGQGDSAIVSVNQSSPVLGEGPVVLELMGPDGVVQPTDQSVVPTLSLSHYVLPKAGSYTLRVATADEDEPHTGPGRAPARAKVPYRLAISRIPKE